MIYDYVKVYLSFHDGSQDKHVDTVKKYANMNLPFTVKKRWEDILEQISHSKRTSKNNKDPTYSDDIFLKQQEEAKRKAAQPFLDFTPQDDGSHTIVIEHRNIPSITINFYRTDLELMFSMQPFQDENVSYRLMMPNLSQTISLMEKGEIRNGETVIQLPDLLKKEN